MNSTNENLDRNKLRDRERHGMTKVTKNDKISNFVSFFVTFVILCLFCLSIYFCLNSHLYFLALSFQKTQEKVNLFGFYYHIISNFATTFSKNHREFKKLTDFHQKRWEKTIKKFGQKIKNLAHSESCKWSKFIIYLIFNHYRSKICREVFQILSVAN